jgi:hypothetical protein
MKRLESMFDVILYLTQSDGTVPLLGDNDNGRLHRLTVWEQPESEWADFRYLLAIGAIQFKREDMAAVAGDQWQETLWFFGGKPEFEKFSCQINHSTQPDTLTTNDVGKPEINSKVSTPSRAFSSGGIYCMRSKDIQVIVNAGGVGQNGYGGHAHNDLLSFTLSAFGNYWIVDPGSFTYTQDYKSRNDFRSTEAHNGIRVDQQEINPIQPQKLFRLEQSGSIQIKQWVPKSDYDYLEVEHTSYQRLNQPVLHRREFLFKKTEGIFIIRDSFEGVGEHWIENFFQIGLGRLELNTAKQCVVSRHADAGDLWILWDAPNLEACLKPGWVSRSYGSRREINRIELSKKINLPYAHTIIIVPSRENLKPEVSFDAISQELAIHTSYL